MNLVALLRKEVVSKRHRILTVLFVMVVLPSVFAFTTVTFQNVIPRDTPVAVVPANDNVSSQNMDIAVGGITLYSDPKTYDSLDSALRALHREAVYAVIEVPPRLTRKTQNARFNLYIEGAMVPYKEPSESVTSLLGYYLRTRLPADVTVERRVVGEEKTFPEYLVPVFFMGLVVLFSFTYLPYDLSKEEDVLDRLRTQTSLDSVVAAKLVFFSALLVLPLLTFAAVSKYLGYSVELLSPLALGVYLLTFLYLSSVSLAVTVVSKFSALGRFVNVVLMLGVVGFSSFVFPVGFFSPLRGYVARRMPTYYSMVIVRGASIKDLSASFYTDWLAGLALLTLVSLAALKLSIEHYRRTA
ncbi:MAG: ABC transporter permease [Halobacteria archaeon]|nr:ABC transporter permease [Halobacteria archaeon]